MSDNNQIPVVRPTQFEGGTADIFKDSVNLFRGDVNLSMDLVSLTGRNGLDLKVTANYGSNVKNIIKESNVTAPTGVLGLGWSIPFERIERDSRDNGTLNDDKFYLIANNTTIELVRNSREWQRGELDTDSTANLEEGNPKTELLKAFRKMGLKLHQKAKIKRNQTDNNWIINDDHNEIAYNLKNTGATFEVTDGGVSYECYQFDFTQIRYYQEYERWEIVKDDGTINHFGGTSNETENSIQWEVKWANWSGESDLSHNQEGDLLQSRYPAAWNLFKAQNIWGDTILFDYDVTEQLVGENGLAFTKACYMSRITDMYGRTVTFNYEDKLYTPDQPAAAREYMASHWNDPYTVVPNNDPGPYQDRYETKFLSHLTIKNSIDQLLHEVWFGYDAESNFSNYDQNENLYGDTIKRTLTSVQKRYPGNCNEPPMEFSYTAAGELNAGAMNCAITPEGATITYNYKQQEIELGNREITIDNPWPGVAKPRVWFGADYVFTAWANESTDEIKITLYTWLGRWKTWSPENDIISSAFDLSSLNAVTSGDSVCFTFTNVQNQKSESYLYRKNNRVWGYWYETDPILMDSAKPEVVAGDNFVVLCDQINRKLFRYTWNIFTKTWEFYDQTGILSQGNPNAKPYIAASNLYYAVLDYNPSEGGEHKNDFMLFYQADDYTWHDGAQTVLTFTIGGNDPDDSFGFNASPSFIALTYITKEVSLNFNYTVKVLSWDESYENIQDTDFDYQLPKSNPSEAITIPFAAGFVNNSMLASGPYLLRYNGEEWLQNNNLKFRDTISDNDINWFAYGEDYAIYTSNREYAVDSKLLAFDPTQNSLEWTNDPVTLFSKDDSTSNRKIHFFPTATVDIATMGNRVYNRESQCNWENAVSTYEELSENINSTTVINQGPRFLSYLNEDDNQAPKDVSVFSILNQFLNEEEIIDQRYFTQIGTDGMPVQNSNGQYPAGPSTLVTSLPIDKPFDKADSITIHRYLDNAIKDKLVDYCVESMVVENGYESNTTLYDFDINFATCDPSGTVFKYYKSTYYPGTSDAADPKFGWTENIYYNGLAPEDEPEHTFEDLKGLGLLDGQLIRRNTYDADGKELTFERMRLDTYTEVEVQGLVYDLYGGYFRCVENIQGQDGMIKNTYYEYDSVFGKITSEAYDNTTADGETETVKKLYTYAYQAYDWFLNNNVTDAPLTELNAVVHNGEESCIGGSLQTYVEFQTQTETNTTLWCTDNAYVLSAEINLDTFDIKKLIEDGPGEEWRLINKVIERNSRGAIIQQEDVTGMVETTFWDKEDVLKVANFKNADQDNCFFSGFEIYEKLDDQWTIDRGGSVSENLISGDAHAGYSCLELASGMTINSSGFKQSQTAIVSGWVKAEKGFLSESGNVVLSIMNGNNMVESVNIIPQSEENWDYWQAVVSFTGTGPMDINVRMANDKSSKKLYINNICFSPLVGELKANFYDLRYSHLVAELGKNANTTRNGYNGFQLKVAETGFMGQPKKGAFNYYNRSWHTESDYTYPANDPNASYEVLPAGTGLFETFTNGTAIWNDWSTTQSGSWNTRYGKLNHTGNSSDSISWDKTDNHDVYGVSFSVFSEEVSGIGFGFSIGSVLIAAWSPDSGWEIDVDGESYQNTDVNGSAPSDVVLIPISGGIMLIVDGRLVFAAKTTASITGEFQFNANGEISFYNVATYLSPQLSATYSDALKNSVQIQAMGETACMIKQQIYNVLGDIIVDTKIAGLDNEFFGYRTDFVTGINPDNYKLEGTINNFFPDDNDYPYTGTQYEKSSLGRVVKKGLPGSDFAITGSNAHITSRSYGVTDQTTVAGINFVEGEFLVNSVKDANGSVVYEILDIAGRVLGKQTNDSGNNNEMLDALQQVYDYAGNVIQIHSPNYFDQTGNETAYTTTNTYSFLSELASTSNADLGESNFVYDTAGRLRFSQNALSKSKGKILYKKYDILGRITEEGSFEGTWGNGSEWQTIADSDPNYPENNAWDILNSYDGNGSDVTLLGRLWSTQKRNESLGAVENVYAYDLNGNTISCKLEVPDQDSQSTGYAHDNLGNIVQVNYPLGAPVPTVIYGFNCLGQNVSVGIPGSPDKYASYSYNSGGGVLNTILNPSGNSSLQQSNGYNSPGWIRQIVNEYQNGDLILKQEFTYTKDGYDGAGYYNGNVASVTNTNGIETANSFSYKFKYDGRGQLITAQHSTNSALNYGVTNPAEIDPNGNFDQVSMGGDLEKYFYFEETNRLKELHAKASVFQYTYDDRGNIISSGNRDISEITYDIQSNLPLSLTKDSLDSNFVYNGLNQRVMVQSSDGSNKLYVQGLNEYPVIEIGSETVQYIYGIGGILAMIQQDKTQFVIKDQQGSTRAVVLDTGDVEAMLDYTPFGDLFSNSVGDISIITYRFTGQEQDLISGLYNYKARFYDPELRRFYSIDPKFKFGSPYVYCINNPFNLTDTSGEDFGLSFLIVLAIGAAIGAAVGGGIAAYTGVKAGLEGGQLAGYIFAGAGIGAVAGALSAAGGVGSFAAGTAAAAATSTTAGGIAAGAAAGAAVGAVVGAGVGAANEVAQYFVNDAFGVENSGSWQDALLKGAISGAVGGAISGAVSGAGGAFAAQQAARYEQITGRSAWFEFPDGQPASRLTQITEAYNSFGKMAVVPLPNFVSKIPTTLGAQTFVLSKFSLPTVTSGVASLAKTGTGMVVDAIAGSSSSSSSSQASSKSTTPQTNYNPSTANTVGMQSALVLDPAYWNGEAHG